MRVDSRTPNLLGTKDSTFNRYRMSPFLYPRADGKAKLLGFVFQDVDEVKLSIKT